MLVFTWNLLKGEGPGPHILILIWDMILLSPVLCSVGVWRMSRENNNQQKCKYLVSQLRGLLAEN